MTDQDVRDFLERMAAEEPVPFIDAEPLARRAGRRAARTVVVGAVGVAAAIAVLFAGVAQIRTVPVPADQPTPSVTSPPTPFMERFDSPLNGLSIGYPSGWKTRAATEPWGGKIAFDAPDVDVIFDPRFRDDLYLAVVSEPLGSTSPRDWVTDHYVPLFSACNGGGGGGIGQGFQGNPAWFQYCHEPSGGLDHMVIFATPTRGYVIYVHVADWRHLGATYDGDWFWSIPDESGLLSTVELRPDDALDTVNPSESP